MPDDLLHDLTAIAAARRRQFREQMASAGFPWHLNAAGDVLAHVPAGGISQAELTQSMGLSKQAVQQLLDQLEAAGVVRREPDHADRRARRIVLSDLGLRDIATQQQVLDQFEALARDRLGRKRLDKFRKALKKLGAL